MSAMGTAAPPRGDGADPITPDPAPAPTDRGALLRLVVGVVLFVGVFVALGLGALLVFIVAIILIVMLHELGHFATAKWSKMKVTEYFVGFGPRLWSIRRGETEYGVKAIPAGGYVKIPGMTNLEEIDPEDEERTYRRKPFHNRIIVASAGSFMHFVIAFIIAWSAVVVFGAQSPSAVQVSAFINFPGHVQNPAQAGGLRVGDVIVGVNGRTLSDPTQLTTSIRASAGKSLALTVERGGHPTVVHVTPLTGHTTSSGHEVLGSAGGKSYGVIGIEEGSAALTAEGPFRALGTAGITVGTITSDTVTGLGHLFSPHGLSSFFDQVTNSKVAAQAANNPATAERPQSLVGIGQIAVSTERHGMYFFLNLLIAVNIAFALLNMLPMLPLDGGHVAVALYERIRTRRGRPYYQADVAKLLPVVYAFVAVLLVIVGSAVFLDISHPLNLH
jgi:membrane-associated protease RseP (regulator of RpoE activity)